MAGGGGNSIFSPSSAVLRFRQSRPTLSSGFSGPVTYAAPSALIRVRALHVAAVLAQTEKTPTAFVRLRAYATPANSGSTSYAPLAALIRFRSPPPGALTPVSAELRFRRGPVAKLPAGWPEGAPYEAGILTGSGNTTFEMLFLGGHDGQNKLVGGGLQTCSGQPSWTPTTDGTWAPFILDTTNLKLWIYANGAWHYLLLT